MSPEELTQAIAAFAADKKAIDIVALDLRGVAGYTDFFLICSGGSDRQTKAIHDGIHEGRWILMDYLDCVVHVFTPDTRDYYRLEQLWGDVPRLELDLDEGPSAAAG